MGKMLWLLLIAATVWPSVNTFPQPASQVGPRNCRIVDVTLMRAGEVDYVDGMRVPDDVGPLNFLRERERSSPRSCLLVFLPVAATLRQFDDFQVIAGKIQYDNLHIYVYGPVYRSKVNEVFLGPPVDPDDLRLGPHGPLPWPDRQPEKKQ